MKKWLIGGVAAVAVILIAMMIFKPVARVAAVYKGSAINAVSGNVTVQAEFQMDLKSEIGGRLSRTELDPGKKVEAGQILAQIDSGDLLLEIEKAKSDLEAAQARIAVGSAVQLQLDTAYDELATSERLTKSGSFAPGELEKQRRLVKQLEQKVALEKVANKKELSDLDNTLKTKRRQLDKMTIVAPFEGIVAQVFTRVGDLISSSTTIATLITTSRAVEAKISQESIADLQLGQSARVRFTGHEFDTYDAVVSKILPTAEADTQRYPIILDVKCPIEVLVPGLTGEVNVTVAKRDAKALIPRRALFGNNVYTVTNGRVQRRKVEVGYVSLNVVEITKGLATGDLVIVEELDQFRDGERVSTQLVK